MTVSEPGSDGEPFLTVPEAARNLGVTERWIRRALSERRLRHVKLGRLVRIPASALDELIEAGTRHPVDAA